MVREARYAALPEPVLEPERETSRRGVSRRRAVYQPISLRMTQPAMPSPLRGSLESLERQNDKTEADNLERIEDEDDLADRIARKMLVPVPVSDALNVNANLVESHRYCRPWTAQFLTGATIDLAKLGMTRQEIGWMRTWLLPLQEAGKIDVEEEFKQACFHITVYKSYVPPAPPVPARASMPQKPAGKTKSRKPTHEAEPPTPSDRASQGL